MKGGERYRLPVMGGVSHGKETYSMKNTVNGIVIVLSDDGDSCACGGHSIICALGESLRCPPETNVTLHVNSTEIFFNSFLKNRFI